MIRVWDAGERRRADVGKGPHRVRLRASAMRRLELADCWGKEVDLVKGHASRAKLLGLM